MTVMQQGAETGGYSPCSAGRSSHLDVLGLLLAGGLFLLLRRRKSLSLWMLLAIGMTISMPQTGEPPAEAPTGYVASDRSRSRSILRKARRSAGPSDAPR